MFTQLCKGIRNLINYVCITELKGRLEVVSQGYIYKGEDFFRVVNCGKHPRCQLAPIDWCTLPKKTE